MNSKPSKNPVIDIAIIFSYLLENCDLKYENGTAKRKNAKTIVRFSLNQYVHCNDLLAIGQNAPPKSYPSASRIIGSSNAKMKPINISKDSLRLDGISILTPHSDIRE